MGYSLFGRGWRGRLGAVAVAWVALTGAGAAEQACRDDSMQLRGDWGTMRVTVEVARTNEEQRVGLMNRPSMPTSSGMLFVYERPRALSFWMRNTLIPLDMLFIDATGVVQHIHHRAIPLDETAIFGGNNLTSVLEINGGLAEKLGITKGTQVRHPSYADELAVWPC